MACDCIKKPREIAFKNGVKNSDLIFLGEVVKSNNNNYTFKVLETFKGVAKSNFVSGKTFNSCSSLPVYGLWIIYSGFGSDLLIDISICGNSISLDEPNYIPPIPPPPPNYPGQKLTREELLIRKIEDISYMNEKSSIDIRNWNYHLEKLREYKRSNEEKSKNKTPFRKSKFFQIGLIALNILLLILLFHKKMK